MNSRQLITLIAAVIGLSLTLFPSIVFLSNGITVETTKHLMTLGMVFWILAVVFWSLPKKA